MSTASNQKQLYGILNNWCICINISCGALDFWSLELPSIAIQPPSTDPSPPLTVREKRPSPPASVSSPGGFSPPPCSPARGPADVRAGFLCHLRLHARMWCLVGLLWLRHVPRISVPSKARRAPDRKLLAASERGSRRGAPAAKVCKICLSRPVRDVSAR